MVDSIDLSAVARDEGFRQRVAYFLAGRASETLGALDGSPPPDADQVILAKQIIYPDPGGVDGAAIVDRFARALVADATTATALAGASFDHLQFTDAQFAGRIDAVWPVFARAVA